MQGFPLRDEGGFLVSFPLGARPPVGDLLTISL